MSFTDIFIRRPVFAIVVNLLLLLVGAIALKQLELREFPRVDVTDISVTTVYNGASAEILASFVTPPLENALSSVDGLDTITSKNTRGLSTIHLHFKLGVKINDAEAEVSDKIASVLHELPRDIEKPVIQRQDPNSQPVMYLAFDSQTLSPTAINDYLKRNLQPVLNTITGVAEAKIFGNRDYAMRIWLDPKRMAAHRITFADIKNALLKNNVQSPTGLIRTDFIQLPITAETDLQTATGFNQMILEKHGDKVIRLADVARAELSETTPKAKASVMGKPAIFMGIITRSDANPLTTIARVRESLQRLSQQLPAGLSVKIVWDATRFIAASIHEVEWTIVVAIACVLLVIFLFLGSVRSLFIPSVTIPISLLGCGSLMLLAGFSNNTLTLLAFVLAIGMVVDDAIVVLENIHRQIENGLTVKQAALQGAREIKFAIIAMTFTLAAVYAPIGMAGGLTGKLFREFAFTLAGCVIVSGFIALTLTPTMCAHLFTERQSGAKLQYRIDAFLQWLSEYYLRALQKVVAFRKLVVFILVPSAFMLLAVMLHGLMQRSELAPKEDVGAILSFIQGPAYANLAYMETYTKPLNRIFAALPEMENFATINGWPNENGAISFMITKPWQDRQRSIQEILQALFPQMMQLPGVMAFPINPYSLPGINDNAGVGFVIKSSGSYAELAAVADSFKQELAKDPHFLNVESNLKFDKQQVNITIDRNKAGILGVPMQAIGEAINMALGEPQVSRFQLRGRAYDVIPQLAKPFRQSTAGLNYLYLKNTDGDVIPLANLIHIENSVMPRSLEHFQQLPAATISAQLAPNYSQQQVVTTLSQLAKRLLPNFMQYDFSGKTRQFLEESGTFLQVFLYAIVFIYLVLAAQFESFLDPLIILLFSVPLSMLGAILSLKLIGGSLNIYTWIGLVTLIGLISKHGILMVEFANQCQRDGLETQTAIMQAAKTRLRPILMTTAAMVLGILPLAFSKGAGAVSRNQMGWVIIGGMSFGTLMTLFMIPAGYSVLATKKHRIVDENANERL